MPGVKREEAQFEKTNGLEIEGCLRRGIPLKGKEVWN